MQFFPLNSNKSPFILYHKSDLSKVNDRKKSALRFFN